MPVRRLTTYGPESGLFGELLDLIQSAQERVWIKVAWWDTSEKARQLLDAAIGAHGRGADVQVYIRPESSNDAVLRSLRSAGVRVEAVRYIHEKELIADQSLLAHSMNFTSKEVARNENSGYLNDDPEIVLAASDAFTSLASNLAASSVGEEEWTPVAKLIPTQWLPFLEKYDTLNPLQSKAVPAVLGANGHVMVVAPTSAGKTLVGEVAALRSIIGEGRPAVWLLPARALASEVVETARRWERLGIRTVELTGETNLSSERVAQAQLWVATTEKFESLYRRSSLRDAIAKVGCLVIDEVHLVGDPTRGSTLESLIARLRQSHDRTRIVALSATVANAEELAGWFNAQLISVTWRPTILTTQLVTYESPDNKYLINGIKNDIVTGLVEDFVGGRGGDGPGSVIVFCGGKKAVRDLAAGLAGVPETADIDALVEAAFAKGIGIHYRGAPQTQRAVDAFKRRDINIIIGTSTLATGVNLPARAVIIRDDTMGISRLEVSLAQQMFGRAGRAGHEKAGYAFLITAADEASKWRLDLAAGYRVRSRISGRLPDALLAEVMLGSVSNRSDTESWFLETFAHATGLATEAIDQALDRLLLTGMVSEVDEVIQVTELGSLTCRLMVEVDSAAAILSGIAAASRPRSAVEAEELVLRAVTQGGLPLRERQVNPDQYEQQVASVLFNWTPSIVESMDGEFGARFCMAAAHLALREPKQLFGRTMGDFVYAVEDLPRYLAWLGALGYVDGLTWAPAVASDLARRLSWWRLNPHPEMGSGRLLWMLEKTLEPHNRHSSMPDLWKRARSAGFKSPDNINRAPKGVDVTPEQFAAILHGRVRIEMAPPDAESGLTLRLDTTAKNARVTTYAHSGLEPMLSTARPPHGRLDLPLPQGAAKASAVAVDLFLYSKDGDFGYSNVTTALTGDLEEPRHVDDAVARIHALPHSLSSIGEPRGLRSLLMSDRRKMRATLVPLIAPTEELKAVAVALSERITNPTRAVCRLRENLAAVLTVNDSTDAARPASSVLKSGVATRDELELTATALIASLGVAVGLAVSDKGRVVSMAQLDDEWQVVLSQSAAAARSIKAVVPDDLPPVVIALRDPQASQPISIHPVFEWMSDLLQG